MTDIERASRDTARMWRRLGQLLRDVAYDSIASGQVVLEIDARRAVAITALADGCFFQATGENDAFDLPRESQ